MKRFDFKDTIIYEDDYLLCINKPPGLSTLQERNTPFPGLLTLGRQIYSGLRACHRLDKPTSGCLLFAKEFETFRAMALQFQRRQVEKHYHTIIRGVHQLDGKYIEAALAVNKQGLARIDNREGKPAITIFQTLKTFKHFTLVDCQPITGRLHQIRAHLAFANLPIVGDVDYGGEDFFLSELKRTYKLSTWEEEKPVNHGFQLHAYSLSFRHPKTQEPITITADYPKNFGVCLRILEKYDS
ncbi:MAG: RluA family pseudouridine synthase [Bacteroidia bacterium]|nr:RluA family pseudouridine synthase [Bacteroidia bacterium]